MNNQPTPVDVLAPVDFDMPPMNVVDYDLTPADYAFMHQADVAGTAGIDLSHTVAPQDPFGLRTRHATTPTDRFAGISAGMPAPYALPQTGIKLDPSFKVSAPTAEAMAKAEEEKFFGYAVDAAKIAVAAWTEKEADKANRNAATQAHHAEVVRQTDAMKRFLIEEDEQSK